MALALLCTASFSQAMAQEASSDVRPWGSAFRSVFGDSLEKNHKIGVLGWTEGTLAESNNDIADTLQPSGIGQSILPQGLFTQNEGATLNQAGAMLCRGDGCPTVMFGPQHNVLGRIGPTPAPRGDAFDLGFNVTVMYGQDIFFLKTLGFDDWDSDADAQNKWAITQWYLDFYLPILDGMNLMVGSFQTPLANEIGYPFTPPNWFASHTYAFAHGPAKHVGALAQFKVPTSKDFGLLSFDAGVVTGWNVLESPNDDPSFIGGVRWRSTNMKTWVDVEAIYGNGANDFTNFVNVDGGSITGWRATGGGSPYPVFTSTGEYLDRFDGYLVITHQATDRLAFALEATYGYQKGGSASSFFLLAPISILEDSEWYGANLGVRYMLDKNLFVNARAEWFNDPNAAHILWRSVGAGGGDVYAFTANVSWDPIPGLTVRPEVRYDVYTGLGNLFAPVYQGGPLQNQLATEDQQFTFMLNGVSRF